MSSQVFPTGQLGLEFYQQRTPQWSTRRQESVSGKETTITNRAYPRIVFELSYEFLRDDTAVSDLKILVGFFNSMSGSYDTFLYTDPYFNTVTAQNFGTGDGATKVFQLSAIYKDSTGYGSAEAIQNLNGAPLIYVGGVLKTLTTDYTISGTGVVTFVTAPAVSAAITWTGSFYYRCRFENDEMDLNEMWSKAWSLKKLKFRSVKL